MSVLDQIKFQAMETYFIGLPEDRKTAILEWATNIRNGANPAFLKGPFTTAKDMELREHFLKMSPEKQSELINLSKQNHAKLKPFKKPGAR